MRTETSGNMFALASDHGIPLSPGEQEPMEDSTFLEFKDRYIAWSDARDSALSTYVSNNPTLFRVCMPYHPRVLELASQVMWYLDEIIIRDRIRYYLDHPQKDIEDDKAAIRNELQFLSPFRQAIEAGYVLFAGPSLIKGLPGGPHLSEDAKEMTEPILQLPEIMEAFRRQIHFGYMKPEDDKVKRAVWLAHLYQLKSDSQAGIYIVQATHDPTQPIKLGIQMRGGPLYHTLPRIDSHKLEEIIGDDLFGPKHKHFFLSEIHRTLMSFLTAQKLGAAVLFDRELDGLILSRAALHMNRDQQLATAGVLDTLLPYMRGLPPEHLLELREEIPEAFLDFRGQLFELVSEATSGGVGSKEELQIRVDNKIKPQIRHLESELTAALKKARARYVGVTLVTALAVLSGSILSVPTGVLLGAWLAGAGGVTHAIAEAEGAREKPKGYPFYFLWRAKIGT